MPRIIVRKQTGEVIGDFQGEPKPGTLIQNAVNAGLGDASEFEEKHVTQKQYDKAKKEWLAKTQDQRDQREAERLQKGQSLVNKLKDMGLTNDEITILGTHLIEFLQ